MSDDLRDPNPPDPAPDTGHASAAAALFDKANNSEAKLRRAIGYVLGALAIVGIIALGFLSFHHLGQLMTGKLQSDRDFYGYVIGHCVLTIALVFFAYQLLRIGERMLLPTWWINYVLVREPTFLRELLGVRQPHQTAAEIGKYVEAVARPVLEPATNLIKAIASKQ